MLTLARILSVIPVKVGVSGRKARAILWLGDRLYRPEKIGKINHCGRIIDFKGHPQARLLAYATHNFFMTFMKSDLGQFMRANLKAGDLFVDIGANYGGYAYMAKHMLLDVVNIEPHPEIGGFLGDNQEVFGKHYGIGLSDHGGSLNFFISDINPEGHSLVESNRTWEESGYARKISVQVSTFDELFADKIEAGRKFHMVKIDVEGHEEEVVAGMEEALRSGLIKYLWCEVRGPQSDRNPSSYRPVCELLLEHGYSPYLLRRDRLTPFDPDTSEVPQYFDILFGKDE